MWSWIAIYYYVSQNTLAELPFRFELGMGAVRFINGNANTVSHVYSLHGYVSYHRKA
jgi:hypothetical protein